MIYRCYHPETGEAFDVPKHKFDELVLNQGWTQTPPEPKPKRKPAKKRRAPVEPPAQPDDDAPVDETPSLFDPAGDSALD